MWSPPPVPLAANICWMWKYQCTSMAVSGSTGFVNWLARKGSPVSTHSIVRLCCWSKVLRMGACRWPDSPGFASRAAAMGS